MNKRSFRRWVLVLVVWPSVLLAQAPPTPAVWTIPGIANVAGQNNTHFVSDVAVTNPGATMVPVFVSFIPAGTYASVPVFLNPGQTVVWRNVLLQLWGASASGALQVTSDGTPLLIRAKTYNDAASGTYGVALPVYSNDQFLSEGSTGHSLWVSQSQDSAKGYRTNISVVFPDSGGGAATVTVYGADGTQLGQTDFSLDDAGVQQLGVGKFASAADVARATIDVAYGRASGYSAVVDNTTGDSSLFTFDDLPAGPQDVLANGVARAGGKNNTFFRTDGRFFNPWDVDVTVTAAFHASGNSNPSPVTKNFNVPAGKILDVTDVLGTLLGLPVGSAGAVRFSSDSPVGILCRTSNVDPTGANPGTYGSQQKPMQLLSFLSSADAGAVITGVRANAAYRTNIAMASGGDGATAQFTLKTAQGANVGTASQSLGPYGWTQTAVDKLFNVGIPDDAEVDVKLTQGSADVYDASVDNASGDSVVTPAPALPVSIPTSATIGPAGGSIRSDDGRLTLKVPAGALASPTAFSIVTGANGAPNAVGAGYAITPAALAFMHPTLLVFHYGESDTDTSSPDGLGLAFPTGSAWHVVLGGTVNGGAHTLTVPLSGTSGAARAPGRTPLVSSAQWGPFASARLTASPRAFLAPGSSDLNVSWVGSSSTAPTGDDDLLTPPYAPHFEWWLSPPAPVGGVLTPDGSTSPHARYSKACLPATNPVQVNVKITKPGYRGYVIARTTISIYSRLWVLGLDQGTSVRCQQAGSSSVSYTYGSKAGEWDFFLNATTGNVESVEQRTAPTRDFSQLAFCVRGDPCSFSLDSSFALEDLVTLVGSLDLEKGKLHIRGAMQDTASPAINWFCPAPFNSGAIPGKAGQVNDFGPVDVGPKGGKHKTGTITVTKWRLTPLDAVCGQ